MKGNIVNPKFIFTNVVIFVKDIEISKIFYCDLLGQEVEFDFGKNVTFKSGISLWELRKELPIAKALGNERLQNKNTNQFEIYFETADLDETFKTLQNNTVSFLHDVHEEPWGQRTVRFFDPDNHLIEIGETMKSFVQRFHKQGFSPAQISERTTIGIDIIKKLIQPE